MRLHTGSALDGSKPVFTPIRALLRRPFPPLVAHEHGLATGCSRGNSLTKADPTVADQGFALGTGQLQLDNGEGATTGGSPFSTQRRPRYRFRQQRETDTEVQGPLGEADQPEQEAEPADQAQHQGPVNPQIQWRGHWRQPAAPATAGGVGDGTLG